MTSVAELFTSIILLPNMKRYLPYSTQILKVNLAISPVFVFFATILKPNFSEQEVNIDGLMYLFMLSFLTGGFFLGILYFEFAKSREYYFYYNLGISRLKLILMTYFFHLLLSVPILMIAQYAKHI